ncbi:MAG: class I SAM-dependent methyltransferase [Bacillota bacterium]
MKDSNWDRYWGEEKKLAHWQRPAKSVVEFMQNRDCNVQPAVLDLGCGIGRHSLLFAREGFTVTALDRSRQALEELKSKADALELDLKIMEENYLKPIFKPNTFDIIVSYNVIYHGLQEDFQKAIELCRSYLKEGGILFFTCPTRDDGKYGSGKKVAPQTYESLNSVHPGDIHHFISAEDLLDLLVGFKILSLTRDEHHWDNEGTKQFNSYWEVIAEKK